ncbi:phosphoglycerate mutase-like protein 1 [Tripterygium wilfordii]|uniref:phosphoglycerate mutase-like protein 1 n=1 Tax=Tripterygium wilfordii TaxID=458696 RepID=UPI0018F86012|nr:phosphoglycerate mutase-like protein 1 [Tripterygium wilfordii]
MDVAVAPLQHCKTIHLVRHAQGVHNIEAEKDHDALLSPTLFDAQLSPLGWQQVSRLREQVLESGLSKRIELVVTSPLLRTMQTAVGVFGGKSQTEGLDLPPLMEANVGNSGLPAISSSDCPPFIAVELCRERWIESDEDNLWEADVVESSEDLIDRGMKFLSWLRTRKETEIAVVSHSIFLNQMLNALGKDCHPSVKDEICKKFGNGELRSLVLFDKSLIMVKENSEAKKRKKISRCGWVVGALTVLILPVAVWLRSCGFNNSS